MFVKRKKKTQTKIKTHLTEKALRRWVSPCSWTTRCDFFFIVFSLVKSIAIARSSDWWQITSLSETDFTFWRTYVPPKREWRPVGGCNCNFDFSLFLTDTNSCSSRNFSVVLRCSEASARDSAVYQNCGTQLNFIKNKKKNNL